MPKENPLRSTRLPPRLLNAVFPACRILSQLFALLCFHALVPFRRAFRRRDPAPLVTGSVAAVCATWAGGVPKPQRPAVFVSRLGVLFDTQRSDWIASWGGHGGIDKAVCLFDAEYVAQLAAAGHPMQPGAVGENFDLSGLPWKDCARPGARIALGRDVLLEISEVTSPCATTKTGFLKGENSLMDERKYAGRSRWYARVLRDGWVWRGDEARLLRMPTKDE